MTRPERLMWAVGEVIAVPLIAVVESRGAVTDWARGCVANLLLGRKCRVCGDRTRQAEAHAYVNHPGEAS